MSGKQTNSGGRIKAKRRAQNRRNKLVIIFMLVVICISIVIQGRSIQSKQSDYVAQQKELQLQLDKEADRAKKIKELKEYVKTDSYIEEVAREKLGLAYPNEIIFKQAE